MEMNKAFAHLALPYYIDNVKERAAEVTEVLKKNIANPLFEKIHVFCEDPEETYAAAGVQTLFDNPKVCRIQLGRRGTYKDLFTHLSAEAPGKVCVGSYCDIYFDDTLSLVKDVDLSGVFLSLAKWDVGKTADMRDWDHYAQRRKFRNKGPYNPVWSQDCWIFKAPLKEFPCDWGFGIPGDDNLLTYKAKEAGLHVVNPSLSIKAWHLHESGSRRWTKADRMWIPNETEIAAFKANMNAVTLEEALIRK
jgi:hypothetical protein